MGRPRKEKSEFPNLDQEEQDRISAMSREDLVEFMAKVAMDQTNLEFLKKEDQHLNELKEQVKEASEQYVEGTKRNKQKIGLAKRCYGDKGGDTEPDGEASKVNE